LGRENDYSLSSSAKDKNEWIYTSIPSVRLPALDRENVSYIKVSAASY